MEFEDIRAELLSQHADLRRMIDEMRQCVAVPSPEGAYGASLRTLLDRLLVDLREHNRREEELLGLVLPTIDAWGPVRGEIMNEQHVSEHQELAGALDDLEPVFEQGASAALLATLDRVLDHMAREEKVVLNDRTLAEGSIETGQISS
jgi:hypothetical protein